LRWSELGEEIRRIRADAKALIREMKAARRAGLITSRAICAALRDRLESMREESRAASEKRRDLADAYGHTDAFKEHAPA
jgi:hypothetical protein